MGMMTLRKKGTEARVDSSAMVKRSTLGASTCVEARSVVLNSAIGDNCDIASDNLIRRATIGSMTYTGPGTSITWAEVGKWCCIARMVDIGGNEHNWHAGSMMPTYRVRNRLQGKLMKHHEEEPIVVGNDVWIGSGALIARKKGLVIGDGAVIGGGAVVTKSVPPYAIVAGVPARIIRYRFDEDVIGRLLRLRWWDWPDEVILAHWDDLSGDLDEETLERLEKSIAIDLQAHTS